MIFIVILDLETTGGRFVSTQYDSMTLLYCRFYCEPMLRETMFNSRPCNREISSLKKPLFSWFLLNLLLVHNKNYVKKLIGGYLK